MDVAKTGKVIAWILAVAVALITIWKFIKPFVLPQPDLLIINPHIDNNQLPDTRKMPVEFIFDTAKAAAWTADKPSVPHHRLSMEFEFFNRTDEYTRPAILVFRGKDKSFLGENHAMKGCNVGNSTPKIAPGTSGKFSCSTGWLYGTGSLFAFEKTGDPEDDGGMTAVLGKTCFVGYTLEGQIDIIFEPYQRSRDC